MPPKKSMVNQSAVPMALVPAPVVPIKLDLGCGKNKREGFTGVDVRDFPGVDRRIDLVERVEALTSDLKRDVHLGDFRPWPWADNSVEEIHTSHFIEHLNATERIHFINECYRIMKPGAKMTLITPHWSSCRAYGDLTHQWPPVSEFWFYYLNAEWRAANAPHNDGYTCNFSPTWGYTLRQDILVKNQEQQQFAMNNYKDICQDVVATLIKPA